MEGLLWPDFPLQFAQQKRKSERTVRLSAENKPRQPEEPARFSPPRLKTSNFLLLSVDFFLPVFAGLGGTLSDQNVCQREPEDDDDDLPDREHSLSWAGDQHGDLGRAGVPAVVRAQRLRDGAVPGAGATARAAAVLRPDAAADDAAADDAAGGVPGVPADSAAAERQQPGVRHGVPAAAQHDGGKPHVQTPYNHYYLATLELNSAGCRAEADTPSTL